MNPRRRRLVMPLLLSALVLVVVVASLVGEAKADEVQPKPVSTLADSTLSESSGLTVSAQFPDLAYSINDSGHQPVVYAIKISTGETVGLTTLTRGGTDPEALSLAPDGTLWIADTGDNFAHRSTVALYSLPEPGPGNHTVTPTYYGLEYADGPHDTETLLINPLTGAKFLVTKQIDGGRIYPLEGLASGKVATVTGLAPRLAPVATDGDITYDGLLALVRNEDRLYVYSTADWTPRGEFPLPVMEQGESLAVEPGGATYLAGSEGVGAPLFRLPVQQAEKETTPSRLPKRQASIGSMALLAGGALALAGFAAFLTFRHRRY